MSIRQYRRQAKENLRGRTLRAVRFQLVHGSVCILSGLLSFILVWQFDGSIKERLLVCAAEVLLLLFTVGLLGAVREGGRAWMYRVSRGKEPSAIQLLYWLRRGRGFRAAFLDIRITLRRICWTVLFLVPSVLVFRIYMYAMRNGLNTGVLPHLLQTGTAISCVIGVAAALLMAQKYALAPLILARDPQKKTRTVLRESIELMDGACGKLLLLKLSFLLNAPLCAAVVPIIYLLPYFRQSVICMLRDTLRAGKQTSADPLAQKDCRDEDENTENSGSSE